MAKNPATLIKTTIVSTTKVTIKIITTFVINVITTKANKQQLQQH